MADCGFFVSVLPGTGAGARESAALGRGGEKEKPINKYALEYSC